MGGYQFPQSFLFGSATASYQVEGAVNEDGRGPSIWDVFSHTPGKIVGGDTGDVADDHYHRMVDDVKLMAAIGLRAYRFSVAWPRIVPDGFGPVNHAGIGFYERLVDALLEHGIEPLPTLYHWDLPEPLQRLGGWANRETAYRFQDYCDILWRVLSDRVPRWITHNEPWCTAALGYYYGEHAPGIRDLRAGLWSAHHVLLSHGLALQAFREGGYPGEIGITLNLTPAYAASERAEDIEAQARQDAFSNRWFLDPIFIGRYPETVLALDPVALGTVVKPGDMDLVRGRNDFLGVNYYSRSVVKASEQPPLYLEGVRPPGDYTGMDWEVYPAGLTDLLLRLHREYGPLPLYVTENGAAYPDAVENGAVHDPERVRYVAQHLEAIGKAIDGGANVRGYFLWSLLDNFEWAYGYSKRFGMVYVDYATQARIWKDSAHYYRDVIRTGSV